MRKSDDAFHIAIPCRDLEEAKRFYLEGLGCKLARQYEDRITLDFFGDQLVCHKSPERVDAKPSLYPRHFGVTFHEKGDFERLYALCVSRGIEFFQDVFERFEGKPEAHKTFFLTDPSNNVLEFKYYYDPRMKY